MKKIYTKLTPDEIAEVADKGGDVSPYFTNKGKIKPPLRRVNIDFTPEMLKELDELADEINISRQAIIKMYLRQALDQHYLAKAKAGGTGKGTSAYK
jgi:hypothetical protein